MPSEMNGKGIAFSPCGLGCGEKRQAFAGSPLHLQHMGDNVNGTRMAWIDRERAPRGLFRTAILAVLLQGKRVHGKDTREAGRSAVPFGEHLGDTIAHHPPSAEPEVERMRDEKCKNVA